MIYFQPKDLELILKKVSFYKKNLIVFTPIYIILTILILILKKVLTIEFSLCLEIIVTTLYFSFLLIICQLINHLKNVINLYNSTNKKDTKIECVIKDISNQQTINRLLFKKIVVEAKDGEKILYLYDEFTLNFNVGDSVTFIVSKNIIKECYDEKITS